MNLLLYTAFGFPTSWASRPLCLLVIERYPARLHRDRGRIWHLEPSSKNELSSRVQVQLHVAVCCWLSGKQQMWKEHWVYMKVNCSLVVSQRFGYGKWVSMTCRLTWNLTFCLVLSVFLVLTVDCDLLPSVVGTTDWCFLFVEDLSSCFFVSVQSEDFWVVHKHRKVGRHYWKSLLSPPTPSCV